MNIPTQTPDVSAISALLQELLDGWNRGSGTAFAAPFTEDADFVAFDGTHYKGRSTIASSHQVLFDQWLKGTRLVGKVRSVRFLTPEVALMHAIGGTVMAGQSDLEPERNSVQTMVVTRQNGAWRIATFQNSRAQYIGHPDAARALTEELRQLL
jgi:uncharacterized protein (TIGR02246 family)